ncbi:ROK family protein [Flavobacterium defluvii]|uniref:Glucokinase n=1 Tax=Flavobacterium defluvii TaxID=370979 RepID=A0A1M5J066_9FLAO|nr:ROK family protein [Flavobacterium defluvii]SHG33765.1 glucokinase [Flavobacterium defluvii]
MSITIGVDIGGSHISSAAIHNDGYRIIKNTYCSGSIDSQASKEIVLKKWADIINQSILAAHNTNEASKTDTVEIAFSMPGPFIYSTGVAMFEGNEKYESLYNVSIGDELTEYLIVKNVEFRFLNDASCFGIGGALKFTNESVSAKVIAITLGTGFGAAFLENNLPVTNGENIPENGCLWDKKFRNDIADNYFSTRWFVNQYEKRTGEKLKDGVKQLAGLNSHEAGKVFEDFAFNLSEFLAPYIHDFKADMLIIGGNIAKCNHLFLSDLNKNFKQKGINLYIQIVENTEETGIIGASYLFNEIFWEKIKNDLPQF